MGFNLGISSPLALWTLGVGGLKMAICLFALYRPDRSRRCWRAFPRHELTAWLLTGVALCWSAWLVLSTPPFSGMPRIEPMVYVATPLSFFVIVVFLDELLAARALGGLLLLLAAPVMAAARMNDSPLSVIMTLIAYGWVIYGMVLVVSPYQLRQLTARITRHREPYRWANMIGLGVGAGLVLLALLAY